MEQGKEINLLPSDIILKHKARLDKWPKAELLLNYGTTDASICSIMAYLDDHSHQPEQAEE